MRYAKPHNSQCAEFAEFARSGGGCRAMAVSATDNLLAIDPQICEMYKSNFRQRFNELAGLEAKVG